MPPVVLNPILIMDRASLSKSRLALIPILGLVLFGFTGCYTQLAVVEDDYERTPDVVVVEEQEGEDVTVRRYYYDDYNDYGYTPYSYRRYFDRFHVGFYDPYWDPWYYDYDPYWDFSFSIGWGRPWHRWNSWYS